MFFINLTYDNMNYMLFAESNEHYIILTYHKHKLYYRTLQNQSQ